MSQGTSQRLRPFRPVRFGRYTLLTPLAGGGMGDIFLARLEGTHGFDRLCVIKRILAHLAEDPEFVARFVNEAKVLGQLAHGSIAQVLDMGVHDGAPYIAMEFVDGKDLRQVLNRARDRQQPLPLSFVLYTMCRVLDALAYAHRKRGEDDRELNLVHRDVSPQNLLVSYEGEVKVIDFGLAKSTLSSAKTSPSIIMGKFLSMSPEQARHQRVDRRSDLYAVGLCLYELVAGRSPFEAVPPGELMAAVANPSFRPLEAVRAECPPALAELVAKALAVEPAARFQTAEEFRARLAALLLEVDAGAGPETTAQTMREAFAAEYLAERKLLAALREQARAMSVDPADPATTELLASGPLAERLAQEPVDRAGPPSPRRPPTRKADAGSASKETQPAMPAVDAPSPSPLVARHDTLPDGPVVTALATARDAATTDPEATPRTPRPTPPTLTPPTLTPPTLTPPTLTPPTPTPPTRTPPTRTPPPPRPARPAPPEPRRSRVVSRPSGALVERKRIDRGQDRPSAKRPPPPPPRGPSALTWLVLPLLAVAAVAGYIGWDLATGAPRGVAPAEPSLRVPPAVSRGREPRTTEASQERQALLRPASPRPPASEALRLAREGLARLQDGPARRHLQTRFDQLQGQLAARGAEPDYVTEVRRLAVEVQDQLDASSR